MIAWMLYSALVGMCAVVAARAAESVARMLRRPVRFVWIGAVALSVALAALAPLRARVEPPRTGSAVDVSSLTVVQTSMQSVQQRVPASVVWYALGAWVLASLFVTSAFAAVSLRLRHTRRAWPVVELHARRVRVSPTLGPIVLGVARPEIVVPRWVLARSADEQRMIVSHEASHVDARDPLLLCVVCALVALMPWNPALWIMLARVRLAIELDCDARVLRGGVSPRSYGSLLVDVAESASPLRLAMTALSDDSSHLHQRILAMDSRRLSHPILRGTSVALVSLASVLAACEARVPTAADVEHMDASSAERGARTLGFVLPDTGIAWSVDGTLTTEAAAKAIPADSIASMNVDKAEGRPRVYVVTKHGQQAGYGMRQDSVRFTLRAKGTVTNNGVVTRRGATVSDELEPQPIIIIDGVRSDASGLKALKSDPSRIQAVEVLKGPRAAQLYGEEAKYGVILVTTKNGNK